MACRATITHAETQTDYTKLLGDVRASVVSAVVIVVPHKLLVASLRKRDLAEKGCTYKVERRTDLDALIGLMADANIIEPAPFYRFSPDLRLGIYLNMSNSMKEKLLFESMATAPMQVYGLYVDDKVNVRAMNPNFSLGLCAWADKRKPEPGLNC